MDTITGIYMITNTLNGKRYIGQSRDIYKRWYQHKSSKSNSLISRAIRKHGVSNFNFEVLEECLPHLLDDTETLYIQDVHSLVPHGYNVAPEAGTSKGVTRDTFTKIVAQEKASVTRKWNRRKKQLYDTDDEMLKGWMDVMRELIE